MWKHNHQEKTQPCTSIRSFSFCFCSSKLRFASSSNASKWLHDSHDPNYKKWFQKKQETVEKLNQELSYKENCGTSKDLPGIWIYPVMSHIMLTTTSAHLCHSHCIGTLAAADVAVGMCSLLSCTDSPLLYMNYKMGRLAFVERPYEVFIISPKLVQVSKMMEYHSPSFLT